jgi:AAA domain
MYRAVTLIAVEVQYDARFDGGRVLIATRLNLPPGIVMAAAGRPGRRTKADREAATAFERKVSDRQRTLEIDREAKRRLASNLAGDAFSFPEPGRTLADDLEAPPREQAFVVDELAIAGGNSLLVAQYKTGKTTVLLNLAKSLADREPFLSRFDVAPLDGRVAYWNYELDPDQFRRWVRDIGIDHPERIAEPLHLRGAHLPFWQPEYAARTVEWLRANEVEFLIIDPAPRAWAGLVMKEEDNAAVGAFTDALDAVKREADVQHLVISTHTGRQQFEENEERSRGATRLEDWMDAGWYYTKDGQGRRALRAMGRDVEVEAFDVGYDGHTRRLYVTGQTRRERREAEGLRNVVDALVGGLKIAPETPLTECPTTTDLQDAMEGTAGKKSGYIREAERLGLIERYHDQGDKHDPQETTNKRLRCRPTKRGVNLHETGLLTAPSAEKGRRGGRRRRNQ